MTARRIAIGAMLGTVLALLAGTAWAEDGPSDPKTLSGALKQEAGGTIEKDIDQAEGKAPHPPAEGEHDAGPLEWKKDLALWTGVIFLVLLAVLWKFAWGPIMDGLAKREKGIADHIAGAEASNAEAKRLLAEYEQKLEAAGDEVRQMLKHARDDAEKNARAIVDAARDEAKAEHQRALAEIDNATVGALKELAERSADLAVGLAGRIVRAELRPEAHADLVRQAVSDFTGPKKTNGHG
ncbi:MAG: F0F1 ATP synthase subunit B [Pirellulales bacterium]|nr:F0F1 ATP synthase subunit B [Pirellulales bacterium]